MPEKPSMTAAQVETQIRAQVVSIKRKKLPVEKLEAELRKYDGIYRSAVVDGCPTASAYIYREAYRRVRKSAGITLKEVAAETGLTDVAIGQLERGVGIGSVMNICILAAYYGVSVDWLLGEDWR